MPVSSTGRGHVVEESAGEHTDSLVFLSKRWSAASVAATGVMHVPLVLAIVDVYLCTQVASTAAQQELDRKLVRVCQWLRAGVHIFSSIAMLGGVPSVLVITGLLMCVSTA